MSDYEVRTHDLLSFLLKSDINLGFILLLAKVIFSKF